MKNGKYLAQVQVNNEVINLGRYINKIDAAKAYDDYVLNNDLAHPTNMEATSNV